MTRRNNTRVMRSSFTYHKFSNAYFITLYTPNQPTQRHNLQTNEGGTFNQALKLIAAHKKGLGL